MKMLKITIAIALLGLILGLALQAAAQSPDKRIIAQKEAIAERIRTRTAALQAARSGVQGRPASGDLQEVRGVMWPGETYEYKPTGVKISWVVSPEDKNTSEPLGYLSIAGPKTKVPHLVMVKSGAGQSHGHDCFIDDTVIDVNLDFRMDKDKLVANRGMQYNVYSQPSQFKINAAPIENLKLFVSSKCPVSVGPLSLSISDEPVAYPGGNKYYQMTIMNDATSETMNLPVAERSQRQVDRFNVVVTMFDPPTVTAQVEIIAKEPDSRAIGGDSFASFEIARDERMEDIITKLARQCHFEVEWVANPTGHPESIEFAKNIQWTNSDNRYSGVLSESLEGLLNRNNRTDDNDLVLEWKDAAHLRVWAKNYDKVLADTEADKKEKEARGKELDKFKQDFANQYAGSMRIIKLTNASPATVSALVNPELSAYYLVDNTILRGGGGEWLAGKIVQRGEFYSILKVNPERDDAVIKFLTDTKTGAERRILDSARESVVMDDRAGAIIVKAGGATQAKVEQIVQGLDGIMKKESQAAGQIKQYRIEAILLQGGKDEIVGTKVDFNYSPKDPVVRFQGKEYIFKNRYSQSAYSSRDFWVEYASKDIATTVPQGFYDISWPQNRKFVATEWSLSNHLLKVTYRDAETVKEFKSAKDYGISPEDLKGMGVDQVRELGRGVISLAGEKGEIGKAVVTLNENYTCQIEFQDLRAPYLIVKGILYGGEKSLINNTLFLEKDKPTLLGLTNLKEALILLVKRNN